VRGRKPAYLREVVERVSGVWEARRARLLQVMARAIWEGACARVVNIRLRISGGRQRIREVGAGVGDGEVSSLEVDC
jgi:hypothetical protein